MYTNQVATPDPERKPYRAPAIIYTAPLEAQAGSPLGISPMEDPLNPGKVRLPGQ